MIDPSRAPLSPSPHSRQTKEITPLVGLAHPPLLRRPGPSVRTWRFGGSEVQIQPQTAGQPDVEVFHFWVVLSDHVAGATVEPNLVRLRKVMSCGVRGMSKLTFRGGGAVWW